MHRLGGITRRLLINFSERAIAVMYELVFITLTLHGLFISNTVYIGLRVAEFTTIDLQNNYNSGDVRTYIHTYIHTYIQSTSPSKELEAIQWLAPS